VRVTQVLITVDTELSALLHQRGATADANFAASITGQLGRHAYGIDWQMDCLDRHGLKGVFFVDPMPGLVFGPEIVARMVSPILARGHEVQLHLHTEWLEWASRSPVGGHQGRNIADFSLEDQVILLGWARDALVGAGAPQPVAFRAGNYGANDDTLKALAALGFAWDSSFNAHYRNSHCGIGLGVEHVDPVWRLGVAEVPVAAIGDRAGSIRPAQICALSSNEMYAGLHHAAETGRPAFAIVTHSFEMLSRDRKRPNRAVMRRFAAMCRTIADHPGLTTTGFAHLDHRIAEQDQPQGARLAPHPMRRLSRMAQQALATWLYERQLFPA